MIFGIFVGPRFCLRCCTQTSQVTNQQWDASEKTRRETRRRTRVLRCRCGGQLVGAWDTWLIGLLTGAADTVQPDEQAGLDAIRKRTSGAPEGAGATANNDDEQGSRTS